MSVRSVKYLLLVLLLGSASCHREKGLTTTESEEIRCAHTRPGGRERWIHDDEPTWSTARRPEAWCTHGAFGAVARIGVYECANARYVQMGAVDGWQRSFYDVTGAWTGMQDTSMAGTGCAGQVPSSVSACRRVAFVNCSEVRQDAAVPGWPSDAALGGD